MGDRLDVAVSPVDTLNPQTGLEFMPLIRGHNVVACRVGHPLRSKKDLSHTDLLSFPWVAPPPHSPLSADLKNALSSIEASYIEVIASGGGLGSVLNYVVHSDCLTILPHTVVFALHRQGSLSALPIELNHPNRTLGILTPRSGTMIPAIQKLSAHLKARIDALLEQIRQHEAIVMASSSPP